MLIIIISTAMIYYNIICITSIMDNMKEEKSSKLSKTS